jgi:hypothetical protein
MDPIALPLTQKEIAIQAGDFPFTGILSPCVHKGLIAHTNYIIPAGSSSALSFRIRLKETAEASKSFFETARDALSMPSDDFPYGLSESQWWEYALSPHSYLALGNGVYQIGLNYFNRFLHLDTDQGEAHLLDPGLGDDFLSTTNWFDPVTDELWFASWPACAMLKRNVDPLNTISVTIWSLSLRHLQKKQIWQGPLGDSLHQLSLNPDGRFLILAELGLRSRKPAANEHAILEKELAPSAVLVLDLKTQREWRLELPAAAHVEFDPDDPAICYISAHNIGLIGPKVGIYGPATIQKIRLTPSGPEIMGHFTHPDFHRITTHIVFKKREKTLIAVSGYPGHIFLIDAATLQLHKIIKMDADDRVDSSHLPHICREDSYGIDASTNGQYLMVSKTGLLQIFDTTTGVCVLNEKMEDYSKNSCFTGHLGRVHPTSGTAS